MKNREPNKKSEYKRKNGIGSALALALVLVLLAELFSGCELFWGESSPLPTEQISAPPSAAPESPLPTAPLTEAPLTEPPFDPSSDLLGGIDERFSGVELPVRTSLNFFAIPPEIMMLMTDTDIELYRRIVPAYLAFENGVDLPENAGEYPNLLRVLDMYFPVFFSDVDDTSIKQEGGRLVWSYTGSEQEHAEQLTAFERRIAELLSDVERTDTPIMQFLSAYKALTNSTEYNGLTEVPDDEDTPYVFRHSINAIRDGVGVCWCFARAYNFLLCQLGAQSLTVHGLRAGDNAIHEWTVFKYLGKWRYADPTWDINGGTLLYFGFTIPSRELDGYPEQNVSVLEGKTHRASEYFDVTDQFFAPLFKGQYRSTRYEIIHGTDMVELYLGRREGLSDAVVDEKPNGKFNTATGTVTE